MRDCGAGCPAALLSSVESAGGEAGAHPGHPSVAADPRPQRFTLAFSSATLAIWIPDTGSFDTVWMWFGLDGFLFISSCSSTLSLR